MTMPDTTLTSAVNELKTHQTQLDMDGVMIGVSRQALDIVLEALARADLEAGKAEESMRERAARLALNGVREGRSIRDFRPEKIAAAIRALPLTGASHDQARD